MLLDKTTLASSAEMHPEVKQFLDANPLPPQQWDDYQANRSFLTAVGEQRLAALGPAEEAITEEYKPVPMRDGFVSKIKIHRPKQPSATGRPLAVLFYGGGWIAGDLDLLTDFARALVRLFGVTVVLPSYRLAPEHKFPTSQHDCWDTLKWLDTHASEIGADPTQGFIVGGVSAGATNTAACVLHSGEEALRHKITGQWLCVPSLLDKASVPEKFQPHFLANEQNAEAPIFKFDALHSLSVHTGWDASSPWRFPVHSKVPLSTLPPTFSQIDGMDPLRDDGLIWDEMLREAGVSTRIELYPGCPHAFWSFMVDLPIAQKAIGDAMRGFAWLLGKQEDSISHEKAVAAMKGPL